MKRFLIIIISLSAFLFLVVNSWGYPFIEVEGYVNPWADSTWTDNSDGTTTIEDVTYTFYVITADYGSEMNYLSLEFESDVFVDVDNLVFINPTDWSWTEMENSGGSSTYEIADAGDEGTTLGTGESLSFSVDVIIYTAALTDASLWDEGQIWGQSWLAFDTNRGGDGGSTAPVPEPATMLLLGTGLVGLAGFSRKKMFRKSQEI